MRFEPRLLAYAAGVTFCVIAWGYLVSAAIDFGAGARDGRSEAWLFLLVACVGAACCLFAGLLLGGRLLAALGLTGGSSGVAPREEIRVPAPPRVPGGRRAKR